MSAPKPNFSFFFYYLAVLVFFCPAGAKAQTTRSDVTSSNAPALSIFRASAHAGADNGFEINPTFDLSTQWLAGQQPGDDYLPRLHVEPSWARAERPVVDEAHIDLLPLFATLRKDSAEYRSNEQEEGIDGGENQQGYHWKPMLWQSLGFIGVENTYRLFTDAYMRHLIADGAYWRDYGISMQHWDMNRWNDGDDFLVDDIGHPMQGAVSSFIAIQNSPNWRRLRIGESKEYWESRFWGMMWANLYSIQQKIGPLGEAALGNVGGYTYPLHCAFPCKNPNVEYTNDTGWTDFIMTPAGGTFWVVGEDFIDRFVSDKIQGDSDRLIFKIIRGSLNPSRTMANALRGKMPWYRDYEHPDTYSRGGIHVERSDAEYFRHLPRYEIFPHFNSISLPVNTATCTECRNWTTGGGVEFSARLSHWVDFDSDIDSQPNASPLSTNRAGGNALVATFGFRSGIVTRHYALKASIRPGFVRYSHALLAMPSNADPTPGTGRVTHFATSLAINGDYGITRNLAFRVVVGNTPVRYLDYTTPPGIGTPPYINWMSHNFFSTNENWMYQIGPLVRF